VQFPDIGKNSDQLAGLIWADSQAFDTLRISVD
jgi:hypothetical protein